MFICNLNSEDEFEAKEIEEFSSNADSLTVNILLKVIHVVRQITIGLTVVLKMKLMVLSTILIVYLHIVSTLSTCKQRRCYQLRGECSSAASCSKNMAVVLEQVNNDRKSYLSLA